MNGYELIEKKPSWANSNFYDEYDKDRFATDSSAQRVPQ